MAAEQRNPLLINSRSGPRQYRSTQGYANDNLDTSGETSSEGTRNKSCCTRKIYCCIAVLLLITGILLVQSCMNWVLVFTNDSIGSGIVLTCPSSYEDSQYLVTTAGSSYILTVPDNKDGVKFAFTNNDYPSLYNVTFDIGYKPCILSGTIQDFHLSNHQCVPSESNFNQQNCFIVRYWPPIINLHAYISCSNDNVHIVWKWFPASTSGCTYKQLIYECPSHLSLYPTCNAKYDIFQAILYDRPSTDYQIVVIRLCSADSNEDSVFFEADFSEEYTNGIRTDMTYSIGESSDTTRITIPFTGYEEYILVRASSSQTISPTELKFNYIHHDTIIVTDKEIIKHTYMFINAVSPIILGITAIIVLCCTCCTTNKFSAVETNKSHPRLIKCCVVVLLILIIAVLLLVQTSLNWILIFKNDHLVSCPASLEEDRFLLLTVNSKYILPLPEKKDGVMFSFTNDYDASHYSITIKTSNSNSKEVGPTKFFGVNVYECGQLYEPYSCYFVRYWPQNMTVDKSGGIYCNPGITNDPPIRVLWKWLTVRVTELCSDYDDILIDCQSNTASSTTCDHDLDGPSHLIDEILSNRPSVAEPTDYQIVVMRFCSETGNSIEFDGGFYESYQQLTDTNAHEYTMGQYSGNSKNVTIPFKGNEQNIEILLERSTFEANGPIEIKFNYIYHDTVNITKQQNKATTSVPVEYTYMYINAVIPIILAIVTGIILCYIGYVQYK